MSSRLAEVQFGLDAEEGIARRWMDASPWAEERNLRWPFIKGGAHDDFDWLVQHHGSGIVVCYLEVKKRRVKFATYGDALFPLRKHVRAKQLAKEHSVRFFAGVEYACGTLVEVDLAAEPDERKDVTRHDRPGQTVPHVFYSRSSLSVLEGGHQ